MPQGAAWEREYRHPQLVSLEPGMQADVKRFLVFLKKEKGRAITGWDVLDLGCGTGRNANALAEAGNRVTGIDIAPTAIRLAQTRARAAELTVDYRVGDISASFPFADVSFDLVLDVTSSNALSNTERTVFLKELWRVLRPGGFVFVRALCKEGDKHAKTLVRERPGPEPDTYRLPGLDLTERVFTEADFRKNYAAFTIRSLQKKANYARFGGRSYKRQYWLACLQKPGHARKDL